MAAQAHRTSSVLSQGAPLRSRDDLRLPALSFWPGDKPATEWVLPWERALKLHLAVVHYKKTVALALIAAYHPSRILFS